MLDDLKFAWRRLRNAPGFAAVAIVTLALAIGANVAIFSIADAVLFRPLPYKDADQVDVIRLRDRKTGNRYTNVSHEYLQAMGGSAKSAGLSEIGILDSAARVIVEGRDGAEAMQVAAATPNYFQVLGVRPFRGRLFMPADAADAGRVAVLSYESWRNRFSGDESIVGRPLTLGVKTFDIVGILPPKLVLPSLRVDKPEVITAMAPPLAGARGGAFYSIVRRDAGVTREQAQARVNVITSEISSRNAATVNSGPGLEDARAVLFPFGQPIMRWLLAASALVLLIGCANLANMLLARSQRRERDTALRAALGASRMRLLRPVLFESMLIGLAGAALAVVVTAAASDALVRIVPSAAFGPAPVGVDLRVVTMAFVMGIGSGLLFAFVPAWRSTRLDVQTLMHARHVGGARLSGRFGRPMVAIQVAVAVVLVFGAVITVRAFVAVLQVPLGFDHTNVVRVFVSARGLSGQPLQDHYVRIVRTLAQHPNVVQAGATARLPLSGLTPSEGARLPGATTPTAAIVHVLPGYFETLGIPVLRGRLLNSSDLESRADVAVVSETAARTLFPGQEPLGQVFESHAGRPLTVVGVIQDIKYDMGPNAKEQPQTYVIPRDVQQFTLVARLREHRDDFLGAIKRDMSVLTPGQPVDVKWWSDSIRNVTEYKNPRFQTIVLGSFAALALGLTALGIFGVVAFLVAMRTREMGVRLAIGATPGSLSSLIVKQSLLPVVVGVLGGVAATMLLGKLAEAQLFQVKANDPVTLILASVTVLAAALIAAYLPARRAGQIDPIIVLRAE